jgi:zinc/manganese transport system substrate-binding protein
VARLPRSNRCLGGPLAVLLLTGLLTACATSRSHLGTETSAGATFRVIDAVASINVWGSILAQIGGSHVRARSIITNPDTDPHDYEPTPADGRAIATAGLIIYNGIGYDSWAAKAVQANHDDKQAVIDVGRLVGVSTGENPHRWYDPSDVSSVAAAISSALEKLDPADSGYFASQLAAFEDTSLKPYHDEIASIRSKYAGVAVGASESIFSPLAEALGLDLITPPSFLQAISEGSDPSAADKQTIDAQISQHKIEVYVQNSQNSTPDIAAQVIAAKKQGIGITTVTETLAPAGATFEQWQVAQLRDLAGALHAATGR